MIALQETHWENGQGDFLTHRLGYNYGAFSFKSKAKAGVGLLWRDEYNKLSERIWKDNEGRVVCVGLE